MWNKKTLTKNEARFFILCDILLGMFHIYGAYYFKTNGVNIGFYLTCALIVSISLLDQWVDNLRNKGAIYKPSMRTNSCPNGCRGVFGGGRGFFAVTHALRILGEPKQ